MGDPGTSPDLAALFEAKARAERAEADALDPVSAASGSTGPASAAVVVLKGRPSAGADAPDAPLSAAEAEALGKALEALGLPADDLAALVTRPAGGEATEASHARLALALEACDPVWVIALDADAAADAAALPGVGALPPGGAREIAGRTWLAVDGFEASLSDSALKRRVWAQLKAIEVSPAP